MMQIKFFSVPAIGSTEIEEELNSFLRGHRVLEMERELVREGGSAYWAIVVVWLEGKVVGAKPARSAKIDYREVLNEADFALFVRLRDLRKEIAESEAVPPFTIFTNEQLAKLVTERVSDLAGFRKIDGIGDGKTERYGERFLKLLQGGSNAQSRKSLD